MQQELCVMNEKSQQSEGLSDTLSEGIAAVMAVAEQLAQPEDMADLFLEELNRLWYEPPAQATEQAA
jgi:hypothetical protein